MSPHALLPALLMAGLLVSAAPQAMGETRIQEVVSPGGIRAYLIEERSVPILAVAIHFKGGSAIDPEGKDGLAYMVSGLLDEGAGELDSQAFRTLLEDLSIRLSFDAGRDNLSGSLRTLTANRERAFELLRQALHEPRFDPEPVERVRSQIQVQLARRAEDPNRMAAEAWFEAAFPGHPYSRPTRGTPETVQAIETADLQAFVEARLAQDNLVVGVAGDIGAEELGPLLDLAFGGLPERSAPAGIAPAVPAASGTRVVRREIPQSVVLFGQEGVARLDPDYYALYVANHILGGGGFGSRLTEEVREKRGLVYSVYSYLSPLDHAPLWLGGLASSNHQVGQALALVRDEVARMGRGEIGEDDLADAKTYLTGSFPLRLTSNDRVADLLVGIQLHDLGQDFLERRNSYIEAVTLEDVRAAASRWFDPDRLLVVVVGAPEGVEG
jgi:zinc protease